MSRSSPNQGESTGQGVVCKNFPHSASVKERVRRAFARVIKVSMDRVKVRRLPSAPAVASVYPFGRPSGLKATLAIGLVSQSLLHYWWALVLRVWAGISCLWAARYC